MNEPKGPPDVGQAVRRPLVFLIAVEESGDRLGAALMDALRQRRGDDIHFAGVGGAAMAARGLASLIAIERLSIIGFDGIVRNIGFILDAIRITADAAIAQGPDAVVLIDGPDFTHRVARRIRRSKPDIPILDYVSPSVWAWRPGRARAMRGYVDRVLAILPFEPAVYRRLDGPSCVYVGHPLLEQIERLRPDAGEAVQRDGENPVALVLPGSRRSEIARLMPIFGETVARVSNAMPGLRWVLPTLPRLEAQVRQHLVGWRVMPELVTGEAAKQAAFRQARAALVKSGTVTLELALAGVPMIAAYRVAWWEAMIGALLVDQSAVILANLAVGEQVVPQYLQLACTPERLTPAMLAVLGDGEARRRQGAAFARLDEIMGIGGLPPSLRAADAVLGGLAIHPAKRG